MALHHGVANRRKTTEDGNRYGSISVVNVQGDVSSSTFKHYRLQGSTVQLRTYSGQLIVIVGQLDVEVVYREQHVILPVMVVKRSSSTLMGRDWLSHIRLDWQSLFNVNGHTLSDVLENHQSLLEPCRTGQTEWVYSEDCC